MAEAHLVVIRVWFEHDHDGPPGFRARMLIGGPGSVGETRQEVVTDSVDWLCDSLRASIRAWATTSGVDV